MTTTRTAYRNLTPAGRARYDFLYELERHHGVRAEPTAANIYTAWVDDRTAVKLTFAASTNRLTVTEKVGTVAATELATFADFQRCQFAVLTLIQSACER